MLVTPMDVRSKDGTLIRHYSQGEDIDEFPGGGTVLAPCACAGDALTVRNVVLAPGGGAGFFVPSGRGPITTVADALEHLRLLAGLGDEVMPHTAAAARLALARVAELETAIRAVIAEDDEKFARMGSGAEYYESINALRALDASASR